VFLSRREAWGIGSWRAAKAPSRKRHRLRGRVAHSTAAYHTALGMLSSDVGRATHDGTGALTGPLFGTLLWLEPELVVSFEALIRLSLTTAFGWCLIFRKLGAKRLPGNPRTHSSACRLLINASLPHAAGLMSRFPRPSCRARADRFPYIAEVTARLGETGRACSCRPRPPQPNRSWSGPCRVGQTAICYDRRASRRFVLWIQSHIGPAPIRFCGTTSLATTAA